MPPIEEKLGEPVVLQESVQTSEPLLEGQPDLPNLFALKEKTLLVLLLKQHLKIIHLLSDQQLQNLRHSAHQPKFQ